LRRNRRKPWGHVESSTVQSIEDTTVGIYIIKDHAASEEPEDTGIILEGVKVLQDLGNVAFTVAMLFGLMYAMNLSSTTEPVQFIELIFETHAFCLFVIDANGLLLLCYTSLAYFSNHL
uniref:Uncharacterized protein n=1 Tax=Oncorhynchus mykiss TaxID=8022 RepID=A0A8K9XW54_ONCMY